MGWRSTVIAGLAVSVVSCGNRGGDSGAAGLAGERESATMVAVAAVPVPVVEAAADPPAPASEPFTIVVLPDTQGYASKRRPEFSEQVDWVLDNRERENIAFVSHVGDIVQNGSRVRAEWKMVDEIMSRLDGVVPWAVAVGNHDYNRFNACDGPAAAYSKYFGPKRFEQFDWFGGASNSKLSTYQVVDTGWRTMLFLHLEIDVPNATMKWAQRVIDEHPGMPTVVTTHSYLSCGLERRWGRPHCNPDGNSAEKTWRKLIRKNPQVFLVLTGHSPGEHHQVSINASEQPVIEVVANYQLRKNGGDGWLRLVKVVPDEGRIEFRTYSPSRDEFETDDDSRFDIEIDLEGRFPAPRQGEMEM